MSNVLEQGNLSDFRCLAKDETARAVAVTTVYGLNTVLVGNGCCFADVEDEAIRLFLDGSETMEIAHAGISPLRQRMLDDLRVRKLSPKTQSAYIRAVRNVTNCLGRSSDTATSDDLRNYQLYLIDAGTSPTSTQKA